MSSADHRQMIARASRIVVKIGSSSLTTATGGLDVQRLNELVAAIASRWQAGTQVVLVSSGAIATGLAPLSLSQRPRDLATKQAAASVGQGLLIGQYSAAFGQFGLQVGQVLLTADDLHRRSHYRNADRTLQRLLALNVVPVINENDTVATQEIRFGDNDRLAALVAHLVQAQALILLSDVDGLYDQDPRSGKANLLSEVRDLKDLAEIQVSQPDVTGVGTGGMASKIEAAWIAADAGIPVFVASASRAADALTGSSMGTFFHPNPRRTTSRLFWLRHATSPRGSLVLDDGAVDAVVRHRKSLLAAGITAVAGDFDSGDPVSLVDPRGIAVARGLVAYDSDELPALLGRSTRDLAPEFRREIVHRDDLVLM